MIGGMTNNVIFALGVVGANKAKMQMMAAAGAVAFLGSQLLAVAKDAEKFAMAWGAMSKAQQAAVKEADTASQAA